MGARARFEIVEDNLGCPLLIRDLGPWDKHMTVTNDAEAVVEELVRAGRLPEGRRLLYYDSEGDLDELVVSDGVFMGFRPRGAIHADP